MSNTKGHGTAGQPTHRITWEDYSPGAKRVLGKLFKKQARRQAKDIIAKELAAVESGWTLQEEEQAHVDNEAFDTAAYTAARDEAKQVSLSYREARRLLATEHRHMMPVGWDLCSTCGVEVSVKEGRLCLCY